ncbi:MAG: GAF domain-containing protein [Acidobacteria bacterium]|nr:MAG: GAF domain-containing protein [Acidobacteriota bacterium]
MVEKLNGSEASAEASEAAVTPEVEAPTELDARQQADRLACLLSVTQEINATPDLKDGLRRVADCLEQFVDYDTLGILLVDDMGRELQFELAVGFREEVAKHWRFGMGQGIVGTAAESKEAVLVPDTKKDPRYIQATEGVRSELAIPLVAKDRTIGVLDLGSGKPGFFTEEHRRLLEPLGGQLANAIDNSRLYNNLQEQAQTLSMLHEVNRELASILDSEELLEKVAELVRRLIDHDVFTVLLWNEEAQLLEPRISFYRDGPRVGTARSLALGQGICGTAAALQQSLRVPNIHLDPRYVSCVSDVEVRSELAVPMTVKGQLVGVLDLESTEYDAFTSQQEQTLSTLGSALAIALENARLYEQLRKDEQRLEQDDLSTAREIQKQLLPKTSPWLPGLRVAVGYEPARHLGGDFYDFLPCCEGQMALAVGDVSGKSTSAALYGSLAVGMLREQVDRTGMQPADILANMNTKLHQLEIDNRFVAMLFAFYNDADRSLTLANSGLPRPYLLRDWSVEQIDAVGVPLGMFADRTYDEITLELRSRDMVVIYTDGIDESLNAAGDELGTQRLEQILRQLAGGSAREVADGIMDAVRRYSGNTEPSDDRTVVVIKITDS